MLIVTRIPFRGDLRQGTVTTLGFSGPFPICIGLLWFRDLERSGAT